MVTRENLGTSFPVTVERILGDKFTIKENMILLLLSSLGSAGRFGDGVPMYVNFSLIPFH